jgi:hypothetical protein
MAGLAIDDNLKASVAFLAWKADRATASALGAGRGEGLLGLAALAAGAGRAITEHTFGFAAGARPGLLRVGTASRTFSAAEDHQALSSADIAVNGEAAGTFTPQALDAEARRRKPFGGAFRMIHT